MTRNEHMSAVCVPNDNYVEIISFDDAGYYKIAESINALYNVEGVDWILKDGTYYCVYCSNPNVVIEWFCNIVKSL